MTKRRMPVKTVEFVCHGEGYEGWKGQIRTNAGAGRLLRLISKFEGLDKETDFQSILEVVYEVLDLVITSWNFVDEKGRPIPTDREGFEMLPVDLLFEMMSAIQQVAVTIPKASSGS